MAVQFSGNLLADQLLPKRGVIQNIGTKDLPLWIGETRAQRFNIDTGGGWLWVSAVQADWCELDVGMRRVITKTDLQMLEPIPLSSREVVPYREISRITHHRLKTAVYNREHYDMLEIIETLDVSVHSTADEVCHVWEMEPLVHRNL
jgi:hypothetical protein